MDWDLERGLVLNVAWPVSDVSTTKIDQRRPLRVVISGAALRAYEAGDSLTRRDADRRFELWVGQCLESFIFEGARTPPDFSQVIEWRLDYI